jgi:hypothetical protein
MEDDILTYPQESLKNEERVINTFIQKEIYKSNYITEAHCNIDPESGLVELCYNKERKDYFSKYDNILYLPVYLNDDNSISNNDFFDKIIYSSSFNEDGNYEKQKNKFLEKVLSYDGWHISSFDIIPHYSGNNDLINKVISYSIKNKIIKKEDYVNKLKEYKSTEDIFEILISSAFEKAKCLYLLLTNKNNKKEDNIICFFENKTKN